MIAQIERCGLLLWILVFNDLSVFSQHISKDNYTGTWDTPASWNPTWPIPQTFITPYDITIYGYITVNGSLSFTGTSDLIIHDTLVILGNLFIDNNSDLTINDNGILIVRGNLTMHNHANIKADGNLIITGNIDKHGPFYLGSFTSNDNPVKVFFGGAIYPGVLTGNVPDYPVLDCESPPTDPYANTNCSYGNMTDLMNDPIYPFFQSTCAIAIVNNNSPVCSGNTINLTSSGGTGYSWSGPDGFTSNAQNPMISNAGTVNAGTYTVTVTAATGCTVVDTTNVIVHALSAPTITGPTPVCIDTAGRVFTTEAGMSNYLWTISAGGTITSGGGAGDNMVTVTWTATGPKAVDVNYTNVHGCTATSATTKNVTVNALPVATAGNNGPLCEGSALNLSGGAAGMTNYSWTGPGGFTSALQNPSRTANVSLAMAGVYTLTVTNAGGCTNTAATTVTINALTLVNITNSNSSMCLNDVRTLAGSPAGGTFTVSDGPGMITGNILSATGTGNINLEYNYTGVCANKATQMIFVNESPAAIAGPDQELKFVFETQMTAELSASETGEWSLISGSGHIIDVHSPTTRVTGLSTGENSFLWKVRNGGCEAGAEVNITVYDLFVPSVITPNGDGKNDYFKVSEIFDRVELIVFNRWGNEEYTNDKYLNEWDGRNNNGTELSNDTYFYILKFENGKVKKGSVLIKR